MTELRGTVMSTIRFALIAVGLFALTFIGISWANKGFPVMAMRAEPTKPEARAEPTKPEARVPTFEESVKKGARKDWENSKTGQGDGDPKREALRLATLQAANAFALSPCDATMKKNLVEALSAYTKAWAEMAGCRFGICSGDHGRVDTAAANFSTPSDMRVREAVRTAFEKGGISREDFPGSIRLQVLMLTGDPGDPVSACSTSRRAEGRR
ncbi:MAG: hypothetical protein QOF09_5476 [Alphaproteobacteria bacterium]|jgi:hypothetical protein|nr:hypothetical protein [Alphaproteobacteria bacterium]